MSEQSYNIYVSPQMAIVMKRIWIPLVAMSMTLASCSSTTTVADNYYDDGIYYDPSYGEPDFSLNDIKEKEQAPSQENRSFQQNGSTVYLDEYGNTGNPDNENIYVPPTTSTQGDVIINNYNSPAFGNPGWNAGFGFNNWGGWGVGVGFGGGLGWGPGFGVGMGFYDPFFYQPWGWNNWGWGWNRPWGWNNWGWGWNQPWGWGGPGWGWGGPGWGWGGPGFWHPANGFYDNNIYRNRNITYVRNIGSRGRSDVRGGTSGRRRSNVAINPRGGNTTTVGRGVNASRNGQTRSSRFSDNALAVNNRSTDLRGRESSSPTRGLATNRNTRNSTYEYVRNRSQETQSRVNPRAQEAYNRSRSNNTSGTDFRSRTQAYDKSRSSANERSRSYAPNRSNTGNTQRNAGTSNQRATTPSRSAGSNSSGGTRQRTYQAPRQSSGNNSRATSPSGNRTYSPPRRSTTPNRSASPSRSSSSGRSYTPSRSSGSSRSYSPSRSSGSSRSYSPSRSSGGSRSGGVSRSSGGSRGRR